MNATGKEGENVAAELRMEHLNLTVKGTLGYNFSNLHSNSILCTGRIYGLLNSICSVFDEENGVAQRSTRHSSA